MVPKFLCVDKTVAISIYSNEQGVSRGRIDVKLGPSESSELILVQLAVSIGVELSDDLHWIDTCVIRTLYIYIYMPNWY